jgi:hypothetical protein
VLALPAAEPQSVGGGAGLPLEQGSEAIRVTASKHFQAVPEQCVPITLLGKVRHAIYIVVLYLGFLGCHLNLAYLCVTCSATGLTGLRLRDKGKHPPTDYTRPQQAGREPAAGIRNSAFGTGRVFILRPCSHHPFLMTFW